MLVEADQGFSEIIEYADEDKTRAAKPVRERSCSNWEAAVI